jgi:hypothetical protein
MLRASSLDKAENAQLGGNSFGLQPRQLPTVMQYFAADE